MEFAFDNPAFWVAVLQIIAIDIMLGGDNAVVIALASRRLPAQQRKLAIFWGVFGAIALRVVLIFFALSLLAVPFLKVVGAVLLLWVGVKLLQPESEGSAHQIDASSTLVGAIKTIVVADAVMSLDNVIAIAGAAKGSLGLVIFGLVVSIPIIVWGSKFVLTLMDRWPIVITFGGALLGWIAGDMIATDIALAPMIEDRIAAADWLFPIAGALLVVMVGKALAAAQKSGAPRPATDVATHVPTHGTPQPVAPVRLLVAVDGSEASQRAVATALARAKRAPERFELHLLNVQKPLPRDVASHSSAADRSDYHHDEGLKALQPARALLDAEAVNYWVHIDVGNPAEVVDRYARTLDAQEIVMGTRGLGNIADALLGSTSEEVVRLASRPVLLVK
jgi:YjbE family integral membrane protein